MDDITRRIVVLARQEASTVDPATVHKLVVDISGNYEGGVLQSTFTYRIGRTRPGQVVMQLQERTFTAWDEERTVEHAPVLDVRAVPQPGVDVLRSVAVDIATFCCPTTHMGLDENEDLMNLVCRCVLMPRDGEHAQMAAEARMEATPAETDLAAEMNARRGLLVDTIKALLEVVVGAYHSVQHHISF